MELQTIIQQIHSYHEANAKGKRISQDDMAEQLGISKRAYAEYYRGHNQPLAMKVLLRMLSKLNNNEILNVVKMWEENEIKRKPPRKNKKEDLINEKKA